MEPARKRGRPSATSRAGSGGGGGGSSSSSSSSGSNGGGGSLREQFIQLLQGSAKPVSEETLKETFGPKLGGVVKVMQPLLKAGNLQISRQGDQQFYAWVDDKKAESLKGLTPEQQHVYQIIASHGNRGVHQRDLKFKAGQTLPQLKATLKKLKTKQLVKSINDIDVKTRQIYILYELDPHPDCTGGAWYSDSEFDMGLIKQARKLALRQLEVAQKQGLQGLTINELVQQLKDSGVFGVELGVKDIFQLMNTMELDLKVRRVVDPDDDTGPVAAPGDSLDAVGAIMFATQAPPVHFNYLTNSPCGTCPVFDQCTPGGAVGPATCTYLHKWLMGADSW